MGWFDNLPGMSLANELDLTGSRATQNAINAQTQAANQANETQRYIYDDQKKQLEPWRQSGLKALAGLEDPNFGKNMTMDPGYEFRMSEGMKALQGSAAAKGGLYSGAALKAANRYGQDYSSNEYGKAYDRQFNRLSTLAGFGTGATSQGVQAAGNYGQNVSQNQMGLGNANASANIAQSNRMAGMLGQGAGFAALAFSDERLKENIEAIDPQELAEMRKELKAYKFTYKSKDHGAGDWIGVMAQDLQKSKLGKTLVFEDAEGNLQLHVPKIMSLFLATMAEG